MQRFSKKKENPLGLITKRPGIESTPYVYIRNISLGICILTNVTANKNGINTDKLNRLFVRLLKHSV